MIEMKDLTVPERLVEAFAQYKNQQEGDIEVSVSYEDNDVSVHKPTQLKYVNLQATRVSEPNNGKEIGPFLDILINEAMSEMLRISLSADKIKFVSFDVNTRYRDSEPDTLYIQMETGAELELIIYCS